MLRDVSRRLAVLLLAAAAVPCTAHADIPAIGREFRTESYLVSTGEMEAIARQRRLEVGLIGGLHVRGETPGNWAPAAQWEQIGAGRAEAEFHYGRFALGGDATFDADINADLREYERRAWASAYVPEVRLSAIGSAGFGEGGYQGVDLTLESLVTRLTLPMTVDVRPRVWLWTRYRQLDELDDPILTPGVGFAIQHAIVVASQATIALSAESDLSDKQLPRTQGIFQLGWRTNAVPVSGGNAGDPFAPPEPGARPASLTTRSLFFTLDFGFPLDRRAQAGLALHGGIRFLRPWGGN